MKLAGKKCIELVAVAAATEYEKNVHAKNSKNGIINVQSGCPDRNNWRKITLGLLSWLNSHLSNKAVKLRNINCLRNAAHCTMEEKVPNMMSIFHENNTVSSKYSGIFIFHLISFCFFSLSLDTGLLYESIKSRKQTCHQIKASILIQYYLPTMDFGPSMIFDEPTHGQVNQWNCW